MNYEDVRGLHNELKLIHEQKSKTYEELINETNKEIWKGDVFDSEESLTAPETFGGTLFREFADQLLSGYEEEIMNYANCCREIEDHGVIDSPIKETTIRIQTPISPIHSPESEKFTENEEPPITPLSGDFRKGNVKVHFSKKFNFNRQTYWAAVKDPYQTLQDVCLDIPNVRAYQITDLNEVNIYRDFEDGKYRTKLDPFGLAKDFLSQDIYFVHDADNIHAQRQKRQHDLVKDKIFKKSSFEHRMSPCRQCGITALKNLYYCKNCTVR